MELLSLSGNDSVDADEFGDFAHNAEMDECDDLVDGD